MPCVDKLSVGERIRIAHRLADESGDILGYEIGEIEPFLNVEVTRKRVEKIAKSLGIDKTVTDRDAKAIHALAWNIFKKEGLTKEQTRVWAKTGKIPKEVGMV